VDDYVRDTVIGPTPDLDAALADSDAAGLPPIAVSAAQGKLLNLMARSIGASRILEIGTLGGYSTIWMAQALPADGRLVTLELDPRHAEVATANLRRAGLIEKVDVRVGPALEALALLADQVSAPDGRPFDLVFIDADKESIPAYFDQSVAMTRPGGLVIVDNVVRDGEVANPSTTDPRVQGVRRFHEQVAARTDVSATTIQTVGAKGYDGFTLALVGG
jgi:predicted O-methyltransferase YrrM